MVAKSFLGRCNNFEIKLAFAESCSANVLMSCCVNENNATSAAETIAEQNKRKTIPILPKSRLVSMPENKVKLGSGSNRMKFN